MIALRVVTPGSEDYSQVTKLARQIYLEELGVEPVGFPPRLVALFDDDQPIGSVGIWHGEEKRRFLTEKYAAANPKRMKQLWRKYKIRNRKTLAEATGFNVHPAYRQVYTKPLVAFCCMYAWAMGKRILFITQGVTIKRLIKQVGLEWETICEADIAYMQVSRKKQRQWEEVYFAKLRPECALIHTVPAASAGLAWIKAHSELNIDRSNFLSYVGRNAPRVPLF